MLNVRDMCYCSVIHLVAKLSRVFPIFAKNHIFVYLSKLLTRAFFHVIVINFLI
jgi:hypothetical protein